MADTAPETTATPTDSKKASKDTRNGCIMLAVIVSVIGIIIWNCTSCEPKINPADAQAANMPFEDYKKWVSAAKTSRGHVQSVKVKSEKTQINKEWVPSVSISTIIDPAKIGGQKYFVHEAGKHMLDCLKDAVKKQVYRGETIVFWLGWQTQVTDKYGNESLDKYECVITVRYTPDDIAKINWEKIDEFQMLNVADEISTCNGMGAKILSEHFKGPYGEYTKAFNMKAIGNLPESQLHILDM